MYNATLIFSLLFISCSAYSYDGGNSTFEKRMHDIYKSSYSVEVPDQEWVNFVEKIDDNKYQVKAGDTLWGLSKVFFGDGFFWSKIWSYNSNLTNPHLLSVGAEIQFFSGSIALPPSVDVNGDNAPSGIINITKSSGTGPLPDSPEIPESSQELTPVLNQIPSVFLAKQNYAGSNKYDSSGMSVDIRPPVRVNPLFVVHSFLHDGSASSYPRTGDVFEAEGGNISMGNNSQFYFESTQTYAVGDMVTVMGKDYDFSRMGVSGDVIRYMGTARVTDSIGDSRYRAIIEDTISPVTMGSWVTQEKIPSFPDNREGRANDTVVDIVGGAIENERSLLAKSSVVFLDGGTDQGLRENDVLGVYKVRKYRYRNYDVEVSPTPIGHIKIFRAEADVSSAFVIDSIEAIVPGDKTGAPATVFGAVTKSEKSDLNSLENDLDFLGPADEAPTESMDDENFEEMDSLEDELETI